MIVKVTALAVGQGQGNLVEVYDQDGGLIFLALLDCGRKTTETNWDLAPNVIPYIQEKMEERARVGDSESQAYLDMLVISHQDDDHWNLLPNLFPPCQEMHYGGTDHEGYICQPNLSSTIRRFDMYQFPGLLERTYTYSESLHKDDMDLFLSHTINLNSDGTTSSKSIKLEFTKLSRAEIGKITKFSGKIYYGLSSGSKLTFCTIKIDEKHIENEFDPLSGYSQTVHSYNLNYYPFLSDKPALYGRDLIDGTYFSVVIKRTIENTIVEVLAECVCDKGLVSGIIDILPRVKNMSALDIDNEIACHHEVQSPCSVGNVYLGGAHCSFTKGSMKSYSNQIQRVLPLMSMQSFHFLGFKEKKKLHYVTDSISFDLLLCTGGSLKPPVHGSSFSVANFASAVVSLIAEDTRFLFPGDATVHTMYLLNQRADLLAYYQGGVMMAPHHGSDNTSRGGDPSPSDRFQWPILRKFLTDAAPTGIVCSIGFENSFKLPGNTFVDLGLQALQGETETHTLYYYLCGVQGEQDGWYYYETNQPFYTSVEWIAEHNQYEFRHHQFIVDGDTVTHRAIEPIELSVPAAAVQTSVQSALPVVQKLQSLQIPLPLPELDFILD